MTQNLPEKIGIEAEIESNIARMEAWHAHMKNIAPVSAFSEERPPRQAVAPSPVIPFPPKN